MTISAPFHSGINPGDVFKFDGAWVRVVRGGIVTTYHAETGKPYRYWALTVEPALDPKDVYACR